MMMFATIAMLVARCSLSSLLKPPPCPSGMDVLAYFNKSGQQWVACENFQVPNGAVALVSTAGAGAGAGAAQGNQVVWLPKTHEQYAERPDDEYYLKMGKANVLSHSIHRDILGTTLLSCNCSSSQGKTSCFAQRDVMNALPPIRTNGPGGHWDTWEACNGVRTFVGARATSTDATFSDFGEDCSHNGFPSALGMTLPGYSVINWTAGKVQAWTC